MFNPFYTSLFLEVFDIVFWELGLLVRIYRLMVQSEFQSFLFLVKCVLDFRVKLDFVGCNKRARNFSTKLAITLKLTRDK